MDRGAWQATVHGVARIEHNLAAKPNQTRGSLEAGQMEEGACSFCQCPPSNTCFQMLASGYTLTTPELGPSLGAQVWEHCFLGEPVSCSTGLSF